MRDAWRRFIRDSRARAEIDRARTPPITELLARERIYGERHSNSVIGCSPVRPPISAFTGEPPTSPAAADNGASLPPPRPRRVKSKRAAAASDG